MTKLTLVSYLNTIPFLTGLNRYPQFQVEKKTPALCASDFIEGNCDIALLPVGSLPDLPPHSIISDYCIGCEGAVKTVTLMSKRPKEQLKKIYLDEDSRSSALLIKILSKYYYKLDVIFEHGLPAFPLTIADDEGILMIGDKVFEYEDQFDFIVDLGSSWKEWKDLPFVFAVWVARRGISQEVISTLNEALKYGIDSIPSTHFDNDKIDLDEYFTKYISYNFDQDKKQALKEYLGLAKNIK